MGCETKLLDLGKTDLPILIAISRKRKRQRTHSSYIRAQAEIRTKQLHLLHLENGLPKTIRQNEKHAVGTMFPKQKGTAEMLQ